jgi:flagellum-specific ATP synthase
MPGSPSSVTAAWREHLENCAASARASHPIVPQGRLIRVAGLVMEAVGLRLPVGSACLISQTDLPAAEAEVVGFSGDRLFLMPTSTVHGLTPGAQVRQRPMYPAAPIFGRNAPRSSSVNSSTKHLPVGDGLLGRVLDGTGRPLDKLGPLRFEAQMPLWSQPINPIDREPIRRPLDVGVRAINGLLTVGRGQRMGLFAGSGVGKSVLLGMMARYTAADVIVVGLIGERGREVKEFIEDILGKEGLARAVVVAAPADSPPLLRLQGAAYATTIAEYFRDRGKHVLLIMDSLTRFAMAQREIALAINEPPATRGYPPSVFAKLPQLVERAGNGAPGRGSITAFYTVLSEGDDPQDPIADAARAILDGHIVLSRTLADQGHYPAIDIEQSISRALNVLAKDQAYAPIKQFRHLYARYQRNRDLISVGAYVPGTDAVLDQALALYPRMEAFLQQDMHQKVDLESSAAALRELFAKPLSGALPEARGIPESAT